MHGLSRWICYPCQAGTYAVVGSTLCTNCPGGHLLVPQAVCRVLLVPIQVDKNVSHVRQVFTPTLAQQVVPPAVLVSGLLLLRVNALFVQQERLHLDNKGVCHAQLACIL